MMPDVLEFAEKHKEQTMRMIRELERSNKMKSNKVRMNISREMHEWFKSIEGKDNDERMVKLKAYKEKGGELNKAYMVRGQALVSTMQTSHRYQELYYKYRDNNSILKGLLGLSMAVSIISVSYLAYAQGWFL